MYRVACSQFRARLCPSACTTAHMSSHLARIGYLRHLKSKR
jgi:hypothetical protein